MLQGNPWTYDKLKFGRAKWLRDMKAARTFTSYVWSGNPFVPFLTRPMSLKLVPRDVIPCQEGRAVFGISSKETPFWTAFFVFGVVALFL